MPDKTGDFSPKEKAIFDAVIELFREGSDLVSLTVSEITGKAGIGKGTAYEYFSDKEEMIATAVWYHVDQFCWKLYEQIQQKNTLYDKIDLLLQRLEKEIAETNCIFRLIHSMTDNSPVGKKMKELSEQKTMNDLPAGHILKKIIQEVGMPKELSDQKQEYLMLSLFSRILCYGMFLQKSEWKKEEKAGMRVMVCRGICREMTGMIQED